jgi:uncharacterized protein
MSAQPSKMKLEPGEVLIREGLVQFPSSEEEKPRLIASRCPKCGDFAFPPKELCGKCDCTSLEKALLSSRGKVYSHTVVRQAIFGYELPKVVAMVKMPEDDTLLIIGQVKDCSEKEIRVGMEVETIIDQLYTSLSGQKVVGWAFRPVEKGA